MADRPTWVKSQVPGTATVTAEVGPFRLIARRDSYTLGAVWRFWLPVRDERAKHGAAARKAVIDAARAKLADWAAELDALEHQEPRP